MRDNSFDSLLWLSVVIFVSLTAMAAFDYCTKRDAMKTCVEYHSPIECEKLIK